MDVLNSYYETLYQRPVVRLSGYAAKYNLPGTLYGYLAYGGATGSAKDALAEGMLALASERGELSPGQTVVEASSGSFAVALAIACSRSHHPLILCMPATVPTERQKYLSQLGAKIVLSNYVYGRKGVEKRAMEAVNKTGGYYPVSYTHLGGETFYVEGSSIGGGRILVTNLNGLAAEFSAESPTLITMQYDRQGVVSAITQLLAEQNINIGVMRVNRTARGDVASTVIETDAPVPETIVRALKSTPNIIRVCAVSV